MSVKPFIVWLAPWAGRINQILCCDWPPKQARLSYLTRSGLPAVSRKKNWPNSYIISPLLTELVRSRLFDIGLIHFLGEFVHEHAKKEFGQYLAILTSHWVNKPKLFENLKTKICVPTVESSWKINFVLEDILKNMRWWEKSEQIIQICSQSKELLGIVICNFEWIEQWK